MFIVTTTLERMRTCASCTRSTGAGSGNERGRTVVGPANSHSRSRVLSDSLTHSLAFSHSLTRLSARTLCVCVSLSPSLRLSLPLLSVCLVGWFGLGDPLWCNLFSWRGLKKGQRRKIVFIRGVRFVLLPFLSPLPDPSQFFTSPT